MRFVFLSLGYHPDRTGGGYRYVQEVAVRLVRRGHDVQVIYPAHAAQPADTETRAGVSLHRYPDAAGWFFRNWLQENAAAEALLCRLDPPPARELSIGLHHAYLGRALGQRRCVRIFQGPWNAEYLAAQRTRRRAIPRQILDQFIASAMRRQERSALRRAEKVIVLSHYMAGVAAAVHRLDPSRLEIVPGGVDFDRFHPPADRQAVRQRWELRPDAVLFLALRRLDARMGLDLLVEGFHSVASSFPQAHLWLAGEGPCRAQLDAQIQSLALGRQVRLLGRIAEEDLPSLLQAADCSVMPSIDLEGFGLVTVESLASGTPVVASDSGANPEVLQPLREGLTFRARSADAIGAKLREVLEHPNRLPSRSECHDYARQHFAWDRTVEAHEQIWATANAPRERRP